MKPIAFTVPFQVKPKQSTRFGGKRSFPDAKVKRNAQGLTALIAEHRPPKPLEGPLSLSLVFIYPWRKAEPKKNRVGMKPKDTTPDLDNLTKQVCDVMQSVGFYVNDSQIARKKLEKNWGDAPALHVELSVITPQRKD